MDALLLRDAFLLADAEALGKLIAVAIPILIGVGSAVMGHLQKKAQPPRPPARRPAQPPANAPRPAGQQNPADEVEEFLKRVAQRRGEKPAPRVETARPPAAQPVTPPVPKEGRGRRSKPSGDQVEEHVKQALDARKFEDRAAHMTSVDRADESMVEHVKSVFEHPIGQFGTETITDEAAGAMSSLGNSSAATPSAEQLAETLRTADGMRQAILLNEVLRRPTHRWQ